MLRTVSITAKDRYNFEGTFELVNGSTQPFEYIGYSPENPEPFGTTELRRWFHWVEVRISGCGTGLMPMTLQPGASVIVTMPLYIYGGHGGHARARIVEASGAYTLRSAPFKIPR
jgi:hypothetical protein